jgi:hypothetical protein
MTGDGGPQAHHWRRDNGRNNSSLSANDASRYNPRRITKKNNHQTCCRIRERGVRVGPWIGDLEDGCGSCRWPGSELLPHDLFFIVKPRGRTEIGGAILEPRAWRRPPRSKHAWVRVGLSPHPRREETGDLHSGGDAS